jgi:RNA polymerase sigma factor (sigma-70 family)
MTDDGQLLRQYVETQSEAAFAELVRRHLSLVYYAALRRLGGDAHAAEDVSQGVFILLARKSRALCGHPTLAGWLYSAVNLEVSALTRSARRRQNRELAAGSLLELESQPDTLCDGEFLRPVLDEALMELGQTDREAILLRFFEASAFAEVGDKLGISEAAAQKRVDRALEKLRGLLAKRGVTSTSTVLALALASQSALAAPAALAASIPAAAVAIAAGSGGIGTIGLLLNLMSTSKLTAAVAGFVALAALLGMAGIGVGAYQLREASLEKAAVVAAQSELSARQDNLRAAQQRAAAADQGLAGLKQGLGNARAAKGGGKSQPEEIEKFFAAYPQARGMVSRLAKAQMANAYDPFFKSVSMSPAEIEKFENALVDNMMQHLVITPLLLVPSVRLPDDDELKALLGDERYQQFKDFNQVQPAFTFANQAAMSAGLAGEPLSDSQKDQLVQVMVKNSPAFQASGMLSLPQVNWEAVMPQAQALVSPTQWKAVEATFLRMQFGQQTVAVLKEQGAAAGASQSH